MIEIYALLGVGAISLLSFVGLLTFFLKENTLRRTVFFLVSLSVGALLGDALLHLIPEILLEEGMSGFSFGLATFSGFVIFFALEKFLRWRHSHGIDEECEEKAIEHNHEVKPVGFMILVADGAHNLIDGVIIGASFIAGGVEIGLATVVAVALHEIPQEIGDFGLLIHSGFSRARALIWNFVSALFAFLGAVLVFLVGDSIHGAVPFMLAFAVGSFIYIAASDLVPELHETKNPKHSVAQFFSMMLGFGAMALLLFLE